MIHFCPPPTPPPPQSRPPAAFLSSHNRSSPHSFYCILDRSICMDCVSCEWCARIRLCKFTCCSCPAKGADELEESIQNLLDEHGFHKNLIAKKFHQKREDFMVRAIKMLYDASLLCITMIECCITVVRMRITVVNIAESETHSDIIWECRSVTSCILRLKFRVASDAFQSPKAELRKNVRNSYFNFRHHLVYIFVLWVRCYNFEKHLNFVS